MSERVLVCGGRNYNDYNRVKSVLNERHRTNQISVIISGMARGADLLGVQWANENNIDVDPYPADWDDLTQPDALIVVRRNGTRYDLRAGFRRNQKMIDMGKPNIVIAFPGGSGTKDMMKRADLANIRVIVIK